MTDESTEESVHSQSSHKLATLEDNQKALSSLLAQTKQTVQILCPNLDPLLLDQEEIIGSMQKLALSSQYVRIEMLVRHPKAIAERGHRLLALCRRIPARVAIREIHSDYEDYPSCFLVMDHKAFLFRQDYTQYHGTYNLYDPSHARRYEEKFKEIWERSTSSVELLELHI